MSELVREPRLRRHRRSVVAAALGVGFLATTLLATSAEAALNSGDPDRAVAVAGSISKCPSGTTTLLYDPNGTTGNALVGTNVTNGGTLVDLLFAPSLTGAEVIAYIKGGNAYNVYGHITVGAPYPDDANDLHAPLNAKGGLPAISHLLICQAKAPPPPPQFDTPPGIYLGYADDFHAVGGGTVPFLPSPWKGDPNVVYVGCSGTECGSSGKFDSGAIRVDNIDPDNRLTLKRATVDIGTCHFDPWTTLLPQTANIGQAFVLTQTGILGLPMPGPCADAIDPAFHAETNFDTSERPGDTRTPTFYDCNPEVRHRPVITLTFEDGALNPGVDADDVTITVIDQGMILNTGGTDSFACTGQDEATPWTGPIFYTVPA